MGYGGSFGNEEDLDRHIGYEDDNNIKNFMAHGQKITNNHSRRQE